VPRGATGWLQKPLETLADLFMAEVFATLQSVLAALDGFDEPSLRTPEVVPVIVGCRGK
jgi:hypothetical protein